MAEFAKANYVLYNYKIPRPERERQIAEIIPPGYVLHNQSNRDVALFTNADTGHAVVSHRGTDLSNKKDIAADLMFMGNMENHNKEFQKRTKKTEKLLGLVDPKYSITLQGHSYGGASALNSAMKSGKIRNKIDEISLYNPLNAGKHTSQKVHTFKGETEDEAKAMLHDLTTTHRTKNDIVSANKTEYGKTKHYKQKAGIHPKVKKIPAAFKNSLKKLDQLGAHSLNNFI